LGSLSILARLTLKCHSAERNAQSKFYG
jgi:hypothetical protein